MTMVKVMPGRAIFEHAEIQRVPRQAVPGMALYGLPLTQVGEDEERVEMGAEEEGWNNTGEDVEDLSSEKNDNNDDDE